MLVDFFRHAKRSGRLLIGSSDTEQPGDGVEG